TAVRAFRDGGPMTLWKSEHGPTYGPALHKFGPHLDLSVVVMAAAASGVLLVWLVPPPLVLPALGLVSFTAAIVVALLAYCSGADRHADGITLWDVAGALALIWVAAGMLSEPEHIAQLLGRVMMAKKNHRSSGSAMCADRRVLKPARCRVKIASPAYGGRLKADTRAIYRGSRKE